MSGRNSMVTIMLAAFCVVMLAIITLQWLNPPQLIDSSPVAPPPGQTPSSATTQPLAPFQPPPLDQFAGIVNRPLFLQSRRPTPPEEVAPAPAPTEEAKEEVAFRLIGVMMLPQTTLALVQLEQEAKPLRLRAGDQVEGWQLESIQPDQVNLRQGEKVLNLPLIRNKPGTGGKPKTADKRRPPKGDKAAPAPAPVPTPPLVPSQQQ